MKLDNERQRELLAEIISSTPITGTVAQLSQTVPEIQQLLISVRTAEMEPQEGTPAKIDTATFLIP